MMSTVSACSQLSQHNTSMFSLHILYNVLVVMNVSSHCSKL